MPPPSSATAWATHAQFLTAAPDAVKKERITPRWQAKAAAVRASALMAAEGGREAEAAKLTAQANWMHETIIEIVISEAQNEVADFKKWGFDISEHGEFRHFLFIRNARLGLLPRALPSTLSLKLSQGLYKATWKLRRLFRIPDELWDGVKKRAYGYGSWPTIDASVRNQRSSGHPDLK